MTFDTTSRAHKCVAALIVAVLIGSTAGEAMAITPPRPGPAHIAVARAGDAGHNTATWPRLRRRSGHSAARVR